MLPRPVTRHRLLVLPAVAALLLAGAIPTAEDAHAAATTAAATVSTPLAPRSIQALPGFRDTGSGPVLDVARFTSVGRLEVPARLTTTGTVVLSVRLTVEVPIRLALSVRGWCAAPSALGSAPDRRSLPDVLVIGQNPVPGTSTTAVAARTLTGRAVVAVPRGSAVSCRLQLSPRTESLAPSRLSLRSGTLGAAAAPVVARAAQRPAVLVGLRGAPGVPKGRQAARVGVVARLGPTTLPSRVRLEGEAELTTCALGYHLCGRGTAPTSVVDVVLIVRDLTRSGRVCATWSGRPRRVTITPAVHHVKVLAPAVTVTARCGTAIAAHLEVRPRSGNAVEVEPVLVPTAQPRGVQTHTWLETLA